MLSQWIHLVVMLIIILIAAGVFTNALEHLGDKLKLSAGVTGSIFAAVATALPETSIPVIAMVAGSHDQLVNEEISVGAILGAPLMLPTLSIFLITLSVIKRRGLGGRIIPEKKGLVRDLNTFLVAFSLATLAMYIPLHPLYLRTGISFLLISFYIGYTLQTFKASKQLVKEGHGVTPDYRLLLTFIGLKNNKRIIGIQLMLGLILLFIGAKGFIHGVEKISSHLHISALLLSLLIIPIATELPEKLNSIWWVRRGKDTLGIGNITGAMVFQGTLLPALGILLTPWQPGQEVVTGIIFTFIATIWLRINASTKGLRISALLLNGALYLVYLYVALA